MKNKNKNKLKKLSYQKYTKIFHVYINANNLQDKIYFQFEPTAYNCYLRIFLNLSNKKIYDVYVLDKSAFNDLRENAHRVDYGNKETTKSIITLLNLMQEYFYKLNFDNYVYL